MKLLLLLLSIIAVSLVSAGASVKYAICTSCSCSYVEGYTKGDFNGYADVTVPNFPKTIDFAIAMGSYIPENNTIVFSGDRYDHDYLKYPINSTDFEDEPNCAYIYSSQFNDGTCSNWVICNDSIKSISVGNLLFFTITWLTLFLLL